MAKKEFIWDSSCLIPEEISIDFRSQRQVDDKEVEEIESVLFIEFSREDLIDFIEEAIDKKIIPENGERPPFRQLANEQFKLVCKYLAKGTRGQKDAKYFEKLKLTGNAIGQLVKMLYDLNHLEDILATGGNWLTLPMVYSLSEAQRTTIPQDETSPVS